METILCFGDSNTWGYNPENKGRFPFEVRWTGILQNLLGNEYRIVEEGLVGRTTVFEDALRYGRNASAVLPVVLESSTPDTIVLMLGTNDCKAIYKTNAQIIGKGILILLEQIKKYAPNSRVLLLSPIHLGERVFEEGFDPEFSRDSVEVSKNLKKVYYNIAKAHNLDFLAASDYAVPDDADFEHMNASGHKSLAQAVFNEIKGKKST